MKRVFWAWAVMVALFWSGCAEQGYDDSVLDDRLNDLEQEVEELRDFCNQLNSNIASLQTLVNAMQSGDYITAITPIISGSNEIGYIISFAKAKPITIYHGQDGADGKDGADGENGKDGTPGKDGADGEDGADGKDGVDGISPEAPVIGVKLHSDGLYYWTLNGEWLLDDAGNKLLAQGIQGPQGEQGPQGGQGIQGPQGIAGITPLFKIEDGYWYISYDNAATWHQLGQATGNDGADGRDGKDANPQFNSITHDDNFAYFELADGTMVTIPMLPELSIEFDAEDLTPILPQTSRKIGYRVQGYANRVSVEVATAGNVMARVCNGTATSGEIEIVTGEVVNNFSQVTVFVADEYRVIMRGISFEEAGLQIHDESVKCVSAYGGCVTLNFMTNIEWQVEIPDDAKEWISIVEDSRALAPASVTLNIAENVAEVREAEVVVSSVDKKLNLLYTIKQEAGEPLEPNLVPDNEIWYTTSDGKVSEPYNASAFNVSIVSNTYSNGMGIIKFSGKITTIGLEAFWYKSNFSSICLPDCVEEIGERAFNGCRGLKKFILPASLRTIGRSAFSYCDAIRSVTNRSSRLDSISSEAFLHCHALEEFSGRMSSNDNRCLIKDSVLIVFAGKGITEYVIPSEVISIGENAFKFNEELQYVQIPENVLYIGASAFHQCASLRTFNIGYDYIEFGDAVFSLCPNLEQVVIPSGVERLPYNMFWLCPSLSSVVLPESLKEIHDGVFAQCGSLQSISIPQSVEYIGRGVFRECSSLEEFDSYYATGDKRCLIVDDTILAFAPNGVKEYSIPENVKVIAYLAFSGCNTLEIVNIPYGVECIEAVAFQVCEKLNKVVLPSSLKIIGNHAFNDCGDLSLVTCLALTPPNTFLPYVHPWNPAGENTIIRVPDEAAEAYKSSKLWKELNIYAFDEEIYISTDYSQDGEVTVLQQATKGNGVDIVLMGDGYSDRQIAAGNYVSDISKAVEMLFSEEPYKSMRDYFNVYMVKAVSATEGYALGATAFGGYFGNGTLVGGNHVKVMNYAQKAISSSQMSNAVVIVMMNREYYAGTCYMYYPSGSDATKDYGCGLSIAYFPLGINDAMLSGLICHEAGGHGFSKLGDEYSYQSYGTIPTSEVATLQSQQANWGWWKNVDITSDPLTVRWSHFLNDSRYSDQGLGVYEGGFTYWSGVWRPTDNSIMNKNTGGFNAPSRESIYYRINKLAYGDSWSYNYEEFVAWDLAHRATSTASQTTGIPLIYEPLAPPVVVPMSWDEACR